MVKRDKAAGPTSSTSNARETADESTLPDNGHTNLLVNLGKIAGIGGISVGAFLILFLDFVRQRFLPNLEPVQGYNLLLLFMLFTFGVAIAGLVVWASQRRVSRLIVILLLLFALAMSALGISVINQAKSKLESKIAIKPITFEITYGRKSISVGRAEIARFGASVRLELKNSGDKPATITSADITLLSSSMTPIAGGRLHVQDSQRVASPQSTNIVQLETYFEPAIPPGFPSEIVYPEDGTRAMGPSIAAEIEMTVRNSDDREQSEKIRFPLAPADLGVQ
jgi:hypothetical protein